MYILATKFYNEREALPQLIANISLQTQKPKVFVFVDDGSIDDSANIAAETAEKFGMPYEVVSMPQKKKGNLDTLGRAWNKAQPLLKQLLFDCDFFATTDVDTRFPKDYFERMIRYLKKNPRVGAISGQIEGSFKRSFPMFTGKVVRAEVINYIDKYWDISIDSFLNIKALKLGYDVRVLDDMKVKSPPSHLESGKGRYRSGRLAYYAGVHPLYAISKATAKLDNEYMRGYWFEYFKGTWRCTDEDILKYYHEEFLRKIIRLVRRII